MRAVGPIGRPIQPVVLGHELHLGPYEMHSAHTLTR